MGYFLVLGLFVLSLVPPASAPASAPAYQEERFGPWVLRSDPLAHTFGVVLIPTGVIELAARSPDGNAAWIMRDNGTILTIELRTPRCTLLDSPRSYEEVPRRVPVLGNCHMGVYRADAEQWAGALAPAFEAMKARANAMWPDRPQRCVVPEPPPLAAGEMPPIPPHHRPCGFPPPEIGQFHIE
jgi:hypothetical protein